MNIKIVKESFEHSKTDISSLAVIIPAYNEELHIQTTIETTRGIGAGLIVVVNDCSNDNTKNLLDSVEWGDNVVIIHHTLNRGKEGAIKTGLEVSLKFSHLMYFAFLDADMQVDPRLLEVLCGKLLKYDVVIGTRKRSGKMPLSRRSANFWANFPYHILAGVHVRDIQSGFRIYRRDIAEYIEKHLTGKGRYTLEHSSFYLIGEYSFTCRRQVKILEMDIPFQYGEAESNITTRDVIHLVFSTIYYAFRMGILNIKGLFLGK